MRKLFGKKYIQLIAIVIFVVVINVPLMLNLNSVLPGGSDIESLNNVVALENLESKISEPSILSTFTYLFQEKWISVNVVVVILGCILGHIVAHNIFFIICLILGGFSFLLLLKKIIKDNVISLALSGIFILALMQIITNSVSTYVAALYILMPLFIYHLLNYFDNKKSKYIWYCLGIIFISLSDPQLLMILGIVAGILLLNFYKGEEKYNKNKRVLRCVSILILFCMVVLTLWYFAIPNDEILKDKEFIESVSNYQQRYSFELGSFLVPSSIKNLDIIPERYLPKSFISIGITALMLIFLILMRRKLIGRIWILASLLFIALGIGPFFNFLGLFKYPIPFASMFINLYFPRFSSGLYPLYFAYVGIIFILIFLGLGLRSIFNRNNKYLSILLVVFIVELIFIPIHIYKNNDPRLMLANENILNINNDEIELYGLGSNEDNLSDYHLESVNRFGSYIDKYKRARKLGNYTILKNLQERNYKYREYKDILTNNNENVYSDILGYLNVGHVAFNTNKECLNIESSCNLMGFDREYCNEKNKETSCKNGNAVYGTVKNANTDNIIVNIADDWGVRKTKDGVYRYRQLEGNASLEIINNTHKEKAVKVSVSLNSVKNFKEIEVLINNNSVGRYILSTDKDVIVLYIDKVMPGKNILEFRVYNDFGKEIKRGAGDFVKVYSIDYKTIDGIDANKEVLDIFNEDEDFNILSIPEISSFDFNGYDYIQSNVPGKKILGYFDFIIPEDQRSKKSMYFHNGLEFWSSIPFINAMIFSKNRWSDVKFDKLRDFYKKDYYINISSAVLEYNRVKYIIVQKKYYSDEELTLLRSYIESTSSVNLDSENNVLLAYKAEQKIDNNKLLILKSGEWGEAKGHKNEPPFSLRRKLTNNSVLKVVNMKNNIVDKARLEFKTLGCEKGKDSKVEILFNDKMIREIKVKNMRRRDAIEIKRIKPGYNDFEFKMVDGNMCDIYIYDVAIN